MTEQPAHPCSCLCGSVTFDAVPAKLEMSICHCSMCRKWSGGTFMAVNCDGVSIGNHDNLKAYKSSSWGERVFCDQCGTTLMWRTQDHVHNMVSAQCFDDPSLFSLTNQIFIDHKPDNYDFSNQTSTMTQAEVFAMFTKQEPN